MFTRDYKKVRVEVVKLLNLKTLTPYQRIRESINIKYTKSNYYINKMQEIEFKKERHIMSRKRNLIAEIQNFVYNPLYVQNKDLVKIYIKAEYGDVLLKAINSEELKDYKITVIPSSEEVSSFHENLPYLLYVRRVMQ